MTQPPPIPPPPALDYRMRGQPGDYSPPFFSLRVSLIMWIGGFIVLGFLIFGVPKFEMIFRDFKVELPLITKALLIFSRWINNDFGWLFMIPLVGAAPLGVGLLMSLGVTDAESYTWRKRWATLLLVTLMILLALLIIMALMAPMLTLLQSVSGSPGKK